MLQECVLSAEADKAREISHLIAVVQIRPARLRHLSQPQGLTHAMRRANVLSTVTNGISDSADIYARAVNLFSWARGFDEVGPESVTADALRGALGGQFNEQDWPT